MSKYIKRPRIKHCATGTEGGYDSELTKRIEYPDGTRPTDYAVTYKDKWGVYPPNVANEDWASFKNPQDYAMDELYRGHAYYNAGMLPGITVTPPSNSK